MSTYPIIVGTFNAPQLYTLLLTIPPNEDSSSSTAKLEILHKSPAIGAHSWLHLSPPRASDQKRFLYCTGWTDPPSLIAYEVHSPTNIQMINSVRTAQRSGYVCASDDAVYSACASVGEVYAIDPVTGGFASSTDSSGEEAQHQPTTQGSPPIQTVSFLDPSTQQTQRNDGSVLDFGGIRHGAHSADISPDGRTLYVADIGRNCIWTYRIQSPSGLLSQGTKNPSPRPHDGPRHTWPHPQGQHLYSLQEHSSMVDVFSLDDPSGLHLKHLQGVRILPPHKEERDYWADEVRTSLSNGTRPKYLYASNRGLEKGTNGYVYAFALRPDGTIDDSNDRDGAVGETPAGQQQHPQGGLLDAWETPTSGGWANAIQPGPTVDGTEYITLTDGEIGMVMILGFDGHKIKEVARVQLDDGAGAATAVWL